VVCHFRNELWRPSKLWTRDSFDGWLEEGATIMAGRVAVRVGQVLAQHEVEPVDQRLEEEIDRMVKMVQAELCG
jgi:trimethylamine:corrinoid methyltransferase-like protein